MRSQLALRPDLCACVLEDRCLPSGYVWIPLPFMQINNISNTFVISGFSSTSTQGSATVNSGPNAYFLQLGINANINGLVGQSSVVVPSGFALSLSILVPNGAASLGGLSITVGSGADDANAGSSGPQTSGGYGASFNSGYGTSLNSLNSYGMASSPVGSIAGSDPYANSSDDETTPSTSTGTSPASGDTPSLAPDMPMAPSIGPASGPGTSPFPTMPGGSISGGPAQGPLWSSPTGR